MEIPKLWYGFESRHLSQKGFIIFDKIVLGIDESSDINLLLDLGIKQFYLGYIPKSWYKNHSSQQSLNRRYIEKEQFYDIEKLSLIVKTIQDAKASVYLALNAPFSNMNMLEATKTILDELSLIKFNSYIAGNIAVIQLLESNNLPITLSTVLGVYSSSSVNFFIENFQVKRVVLPRDMMLDEIEKIVLNHPNVEFEVFLYGDSCRWSDGHCYVEHGFNSIDKGLPFCMHLKDTKFPIQKMNPLFKAHIRNNTTIQVKSFKTEKQIVNEFSSKDSFSKTSSEAIKDSLSFFGKFENIKGYKIPTRGRNITKTLAFMTSNSKKHYQTALYL